MEDDPISSLMPTGLAEPKSPSDAISMLLPSSVHQESEAKVEEAKKQYGEYRQNRSGAEALTEFVAKKSVPFASGILRGDFAAIQGRAVNRVRAGIGDNEDYKIAGAVRWEQERQAGQSTGRAVLEAAGEAPAVVGEAMVGGTALKGVGLAGKTALGAAAGQAATAPLMPSLWFEDSNRRAAKNGGNWFDPENVAAPLAKAAVTNVILGQIGKFANSQAVAGTASTALGRFAAKSAVAGAAMPVESAAAEALTGGVQDALDSAGFGKYLDPKEDRYKTFRDALAGKWGDVGTKLATDSILGAGFAAFHGKESKAVEEAQKQIEKLPEAPTPSEKPTQEAETTPTKPSEGAEITSAGGERPRRAPESPQTGAEPPATPEAAGREIGRESTPREVGDYASRAKAFEQAAGSDREAHFVALDTDNMGGLAKKFGQEKAKAFEQQALGIVHEELAKAGETTLHRGGQDAQSDEHTAVVSAPKEAVDQALRTADARIRTLADQFGAVPRTSSKEGPSKPGLTAFAEPIQKGSKLATVDQEAGMGLETMKGRRAFMEGTHPVVKEVNDAVRKSVQSGQTPEAAASLVRRGEEARFAEDQARTTEGSGRAQGPPAEGGRPADSQGPPAGPPQAGPAPVPGTEGRAGEQAGVADHAAELLFRQQAQTVLPRISAAKADFGPTEAEVKQAGQSFVDRVVDGFKELGGAIAARTSRLSENAGNSIARFISARSAAGEHAPLLIDTVLPDPNQSARHLDLIAGATLVEMRLRNTRKAYLDASAKAAIAGDKEAAEKYQKIAENVGTVTGKPLEKDGDPFKNPLLHEQDFENALKDPEVQQVLAKYRESVGPVLDRNYRASEGIADADPIEHFTQIEGMPVNLKAWKSGDGGVGVQTAGNLKNPRARRSLFARRAEGAAEGYDLSMSSMIDHSLKTNAESAAKVQMYRQLVADGLAQFGERGSRPNGWTHEIPDAVPARGLKSLAKTGETSLFFKDQQVMKEVRQALNVDLPWRRLPGAGIFNTAMLVSFGEMTAHTKNLMTMVFKPSMRPVRELLPNIVRVVRSDPETRSRLVELAQVGALKPHGFESNDFKEQSKLNPLKWTGKLLDVVDRAMRLSADSAFDRLAQRKGVKATEGARRDFINQLGQYNRRAQNTLIQAARDTGIGPFATAGSNFYVNSLRNLFLGHGVRTETVRADLALRAEMLARFAAVAAIVPVWNYFATGRVDGDDKTPIGAIHLGKDEKGNTRYFDLLALTGITRGLRQTGLMAMGEGLRPGAKAAGAKTGETVDKAAGDIGRGILHPFEGPAIQFLHTLATGQDTLGRQEAVVAKGGESQAGYNAIAALIHMNPVIAAIAQAAKLDPKIQKTDTFREVMKQAGPYGIKTGTQPPGAPHRSITVPVKAK